MKPTLTILFILSLAACATSPSADQNWDYDSGWHDVYWTETLSLHHNLNVPTDQMEIHFLIDSDLPGRDMQRGGPQHIVHGLPDGIGINTMFGKSVLDVGFNKMGVKRVRVQIRVMDEGVKREV